jgi:hypothetical protein
MSAVFDDEGFARETLDVGQYLKQRVCFLDQCVHLAVPYTGK